jgi:protein-L-isoaspartate(D-aspartate) O-methyltransferase
VIEPAPKPALYRMVHDQIEARGIRDPRVLDAFLRVDRIDFVPEEVQSQAYEDGALGIGWSQTISQPYMVALMTAELELTGQERILEIGTGSGYQAAILAHLAREVCTIEYEAALAGRAEILLEALGFTNIKHRTGDGTLGWPEEAPFDRILAAAAAPDVPPTFLEQLADPGIILLPIGPPGNQRLLKISRQGGQDTRREFCPCAFVPMRGQYGFPA